MCLCTLAAKAQTPAEKQQVLLLGIGGGVTSPSTTLKENANLGNLTHYNINAYVPIWSFGGATGGVINFGINARGEYFSGNTDYNTSNYTGYNITGQTSAPTIAAKGNGSPKDQGFKTELGVQANFPMGKFTLSPIVNASYFNLKQKAFNIIQNSSVNGKAYDYNLYSQAETKTTGVGVIPKVQLKYKFGKDNRFEVYAEGNYVFGPMVNNETTTFKPQGSANPRDGSYSIDQLITGTSVAQTKSNTYNSVGLNFGIAIWFSKKGYDHYKAHSDMGSYNTNTNPYYVGSGLAGESLRTANTGNGQNQDSATVVQSKRLRGKVIKMGDKGALAVADNPLYDDNGSVVNNPLFAGSMVFANDYSVTDKSVLDYLKTAQLVIKKGNYKANYATNPFGDITLNLATPISAKGITQSGIKRQSFDGYRCDTGCKEEGTYCFTCKVGKADALKYEFAIIPIVDGDDITGIVLSNSGISKSGEKLTERSFLSKKGYDSWKAHSDMGARTNTGDQNQETKAQPSLIGAGQVAGIAGGAVAGKTVNPLYQENGGGQTNPTAGMENINAVHSNPLYKGNGTSGINPLAKESAPQKVKCSCGIEIYGKDEEACKRICQFLKDGTYGSAKLSPEILTQIKDDYLNSLFTIENGVSVMKPGLFKEILKPSDAVGQRVSITKAGKSYSFLGSQDDLVKIISIPSNRATACSDCNESATCENSYHYDCCCSNGYCWCLMCIEKSTLSLPDGAKLVNNDNSGNSDQPSTAAVAKPGNPIGGIVVKGGRNPGGQMVTTTSNGAGEVEFTKLAAGNYKFTTSFLSNAKKDVRTYTGGRKTESQTNNSAKPGQPIGGIIVKGGRNPSGQILSVISNEKGEISFRITEPGNYKLVLTAPTDPKQYSSFRKGWDGVVKGGSK